MVFFNGYSVYLYTLVFLLKFGNLKFNCEKCEIKFVTSSSQIKIKHLH